MDRKLFKAYIKTIVEEEVERILPKLIKEQLEKELTAASGNMVTESKTATPSKKFSRGELAGMLGLSREGDTIRASTSGMMTSPTANNRPQNVPDYVVNAIERDYSQLMKAMNTKK